MSPSQLPFSAALPANAELITVGKCVLGHRAPRTRIGRAWGLGRQRLHELQVLLRYWHGGPCPDLRRSETFLRIALPHLGDRAASWAAAWVPKLFAKLGREGIEARAEEVALKGVRGWKADTVAQHLGVTYAEREALGLRTIGACDLTKDQRAKARAERKRAYQKARRVAAGATPRELSASVTKPWLAAGYNCRRTWERHGKRPRVASSGTITVGALQMSPNLRQPAPAEPPQEAFEKAGYLRQGRPSGLTPPLTSIQAHLEHLRSCASTPLERAIDRFAAITGFVRPPPLPHGEGGRRR